MQLNTILKYYLLTVTVSAAFPFGIFRLNSYTINPLIEIAIVIGITAAANLTQFLLLIKAGFKARLTIVPFATVIPAIGLYYFLLDLGAGAYIPSHLDRNLAALSSIALNIFVGVYAYEKILSSRTRDVSAKN